MTRLLLLIVFTFAVCHAGAVIPDVSSNVVLDILKDPQNLVSDKFAVPDSLHKQTSYWVKIYSVYPSTTFIFHHSRYPWIIFDVLDTTGFFGRPKKHMTNKLNAALLLKQRRDLIKKTLNSLAHRATYEGMNELEERIYYGLREIPGNRKAVFLAALKHLRVQTGQRDYFVGGLKEYDKLYPKMKKVFADHCLPDELLRLPLVESSFNSTATSRAGAAGVWQIMSHIGKVFKLINSEYDKRRSPVKATEIAAILLKENHLILGNWPLAVTAYNHGPRGVKVAAEKAKSTDLGEIISRYQSKNFSFASSNYYTEFLAALYIEKYRHLVFNTNEESNLVPLSVTYLPAATSPETLVEVLGLSQADLTYFNPELKDSIRNNLPLKKGSKLHLPPKFKRLAEDLLSQRLSPPNVSGT